MSAVAAPHASGRAILWLERAVLTGGLVSVSGMCWLYLLRAAPAAHAGVDASALQELALALPMWAMMMTGMMLPTATPMVLTFAAASRRSARGHPSRVLLFILVYVALWAVVGTAGAAAQVGLRAASLLSPGGASTHPLLSGALLLFAGAYQLSPTKQACLRACRTPLGFLLTEWRPGTAGALRMGLRHGVECVRCCWALMALAFVLGAMNLLWMAILTLLMLAEKVLPGGQRLGTAAGTALLAWGAWIIVAAA